METILTDEMDDCINNVCNWMFKYQKLHHTEKMCITNTQILYDIIKYTYPHLKVEAKTVVCISNDDINSITRIITHVVVVINDTEIYDPSYEIISLQNVQYIENVKQFMRRTKDAAPKELLIQTIDDIVALTKLANRINSGELIITDKDYYNELFDYLLSKCDGMMETTKGWGSLSKCDGMGIGKGKR
jgi:hypothetical protein